MNKSYYCLGLMSGTSGDGVDASVIKSDGENKFNEISNFYRKYDQKTKSEIHSLQEDIRNKKNKKIPAKQILVELSLRLKDLSEKITDFHIDFSKSIISKTDVNLIGFHGQTILHYPEEKISVQLGEGELLSKKTERPVVYNFRENDIKNGGEGAPLTPIFHKLLAKKYSLDTPLTILNIGGITNITLIEKDLKISSYDIGPGNCMIDKWIRLNSKFSYDAEGKIAKKGKVDHFILNQTLDNFYSSEISKKKSYDINDFDIQFAKGLSLENGAATLTAITIEIITHRLNKNNILLCGGGRKNLFFVENLKKKFKKKIQLIDDFNINGDFVESQAFGYLAIRSMLKKPITFPSTTGCKIASLGGKYIQNF